MGPFFESPGSVARRTSSARTRATPKRTSGVEGPDQARRVARRHADELRAEAFRIVRGRVEAQTREGMFLAALPDRLHPRLLVRGPEAALFRRRVDDEVRLLH